MLDEYLKKLKKESLTHKKTLETIMSLKGEIVVFGRDRGELYIWVQTDIGLDIEWTPDGGYKIEKIGTDLEAMKKELEVLLEEVPRDNVSSDDLIKPLLDDIYGGEKV